MIKAALVLVLLLASSFAVFADLAPPPKDPKAKPAGVLATMDIKLDREAKEARLIIPKSQIKKLRAELEQLDDDSTNTASIEGNDSGGGQLRTVISGIFLSLAIVFGGVWFARSSKSKTAKTAVAALLIGSAAGATSYVLANAGPPAEARKITGKMFSQIMQIYGIGWGQVRLESGSGNNITLIVPNPKEPENKPAE